MRYGGTVPIDFRPAMQTLQMGFYEEGGDKTNYDEIWIDIVSDSSAIRYIRAASVRSANDRFAAAGISRYSY